MNWLQIIATAELQKTTGIWDKIKNPALTGLLGLSLLGNPDPANAKHKTTKPPITQKHVTPKKQIIPKHVNPPKSTKTTTQPAQEPVNIDDWVDRVIQQESGGKATKPNGQPLLSSTGARGLMQIMPKTWAEVTKSMFGKELPFQQADDPVLNRQVGTFYLKWIQTQLRKMMHKEPSINQILAAYNGGIGNLKRHNWQVSGMPLESRNYARNITNMPQTNPY